MSISRDKKEKIEINKAFEKLIGYTFKNKELLVLALTHSSYTNESRRETYNSNERLEFLGDSVLSVVISKFLYTTQADMTEGNMSKIRALIVCESSLARVARKISLDKYLLLGKGEEVTGGRKRDSILSDAFEALLGAIFLDSGIEQAELFILKVTKKIIIDVLNGDIVFDYKTKLQEAVQHDGILELSYNIIEERGPDHNKEFVANVVVNGKVKGEGIGKTKKDAEQEAAKKALEDIKNGKK